MRQGFQFQELAGILGWNWDLQSVEFEGLSCGNVVIVGQGANGTSAQSALLSAQSIYYV